MDGIKNHFPAKNALDCRILHVQFQNFSTVIPQIPAEAALQCFVPDTNFRLARQRSHCSSFTKQPLNPRFVGFSFDQVVVNITSSSVELLPRRAGTAPASPPSHLPRNGHRSRSSLPHHRLHYRPCCLPRLAAVTLHLAPTEATSRLATAATSMMQQLTAARKQRHDWHRHVARARTCRRRNVSVLFPHDFLYLRLTLG